MDFTSFVYYYLVTFLISLMLTFMIYLLSYKKLDSTYRDQKRINTGVINVNDARRNLCFECFPDFNQQISGMQVVVPT